MFSTFVCFVILCFIFCLQYNPTTALEVAEGIQDEPTFSDGLNEFFDSFQVTPDEVKAINEEPCDSQETVEVSETEQDSSDATASTDGYVWDNFEGLSLTALRKMAKTHGVSRYSRLERHELVFEINVCRGTKYVMDVAAV